MKDKVILLDKFSNLEKLYNKEIASDEKNKKKIFTINYKQKKKKNKKN
ncbi:hypothetical protein [Fusobacterium animalis]|nr:hypothetical protein [Fusobacterium animalis]